VSVPERHSQTSEEGDSQNAGGAGGMGGAEHLPMASGVCDGVDCGDNSVCFDEGGQALCQCLSGFEGEDCHDINECAVPDRCGAYGACVNLPGAFFCDCPAGTEFTSGECADIDECRTGTDACAESATCTNAEGTHLCTCEPGRFGDGTFCKLEDHCDENPCGEGICTNTRDGFSCACPLGSSGEYCQNTCPENDPIVFASAELEDAVRHAAGLFGDSSVTPAHLTDKTALAVPPPSSDEENIGSLAGLECWPTLRILDLKGHTTENIQALSSLGALETLDLQCSQATDLSALSGLALLRHLNLSKGALCGTTQRQAQDLSFVENLINLRHLDANGWGYLGDLTPLESLARLEHLGLRASDIKNVSALGTLSQLHSLSLAETLSALFRLEELDLGFNQVSDIAPISALERLKILYLDENQIDDIDPLSSMQHLLALDLSGNHIDDIAPLVQNFFFSGGQLWLNENPLVCEEAATALYTLASRGVSLQSDCD
jgi:Leucine-rich repeat (LRR) protein